MLFRQKLAFFVLGCVFVIVGQVVTGVVVPSATAQGGLQDAEFNEVTVRSLVVVDALGDAKVSLHTRLGGGRVKIQGSRPKFTMQNHRGRDLVEFGRNDEDFGGYISVYDDDGNHRAQMSVSPYGGFVSAFGKSDGIANIQINQYGNGAVGTWDKNGYKQ
jgi:hypothetical protein